MSSQRRIEARIGQLLGPARRPKRNSPECGLLWLPDLIGSRVPSKPRFESRFFHFCIARQPNWKACIAFGVDQARGRQIANALIRAEDRHAFRLLARALRRNREES
jgi:hypothetical protein